MRRKGYPSDPTHAQWKRLKRLRPQARPGGRPRSVNLREVIHGILYIVRGGCAWRLMPHDLPPWSTCYDHFREWRNGGAWRRIDDTLRDQVRREAKRKVASLPPGRRRADPRPRTLTTPGPESGGRSHPLLTREISSACLLPVARCRSGRQQRDTIDSWTRAM